MNSREAKYRAVAELSMRQAKEYLTKGNYARAFSHFLVMLQLEPELSRDFKEDFVYTLCELGLALEAKNNYSSLFECYERALEVLPNCCELQNNFGAHLLRLWEEAFIAHFGKRSKRHTISLMCDLFAVDCGLKPAYLWDTLHPNVQKIEALLKWLYEKSALKNNLNVITIGEDVFIVHLKELLLHIKEFLRINCETFLIDVSMSLEKPVLAASSDHSLFRLHLQDVLSQLNKFQANINNLNVLTIKKDIVNIEVDKSWSLSTIFGALLGYPILYYCKNNNGNCLSMCPLRVFSVDLEIVNDTTTRNIEKHSVRESAKNTFRHTVYSFSVPDSIAAKVSPKIENWFCSLLEKLQGHVSVLKLLIKEEITTPSIVTL